jgi:putative transposase
MRGRFETCRMSIYGSVIPGGVRLARIPINLSAAAKRRLKWVIYYETCKDARATCRHFDISPQTFYRWKARYDPRRLESLESRSSRPYTVRKPTTPPELETAVLTLRRQYPRWGKDKLVVLLRGQGVRLSTSMVGRILRRLKDRGVLVEPMVPVRLRGMATRRRGYAVRKPKAYTARRPGDLVEIDTLDVRPLPNVLLKHFTGRDVLSRWDVMEAHYRATAVTAEQCLDSLVARMPFRVKAIQVDGGSEFAGAFETACQQRRIRLFVLPPRSPKLNGHVERAHRTHLEEFYQVVAADWTVARLNQQLLAWEIVYNTVRPHQALGYLTPEQFVRQWHLQHAS